MSAAKRNRDVFAEHFGVTITNKFQHVPHAQRRSVMHDLEKEFEAEFHPYGERPVPQLGRHLGLVLAGGMTTATSPACAVPGSLRYFYADIARDDTPDRLTTLLRDRDYDGLLNDHDSSRIDPETQAKIIRDFLEAYFPLPSSFERPVA